MLELRPGRVNFVTVTRASFRLNQTVSLDTPDWQRCVAGTPCLDTRPGPARRTPHPPLRSGKPLDNGEKKDDRTRFGVHLLGVAKIFDRRQGRVFIYNVSSRLHLFPRILVREGTLTTGGIFAVAALN